ncbi:uncharacterized protein LOC100841949 isoform X3 [Brachypodium distachyon]|nr:uncharacterized protein LOC100841949 isoform X3 [Brachypodium distachyon]|eukprot:XP_003570903.1 uncharacterized protein LOC100841949 isoform X3 [Brachypodium distachyon]
MERHSVGHGSTDKLEAVSSREFQTCRGLAPIAGCHTDTSRREPMQPAKPAAGLIRPPAPAKARPSSGVARLLLLRAPAAAVALAAALAVSSSSPALPPAPAPAQQQAAPAPEDTMRNVPRTLSGEEGKGAERIKHPRSPMAARCTSKCVSTCVLGGAGAPGVGGPFNVRRPLVVFKDGFRSRQYCLVECSDVCNLIKDGEDDQ